MPFFTNRGITPLPVVVAGATWNTVGLDASITLSNGSLTMACASGDGGAFATASASTGKKYWEISFDTFTSGSPDTFGFGNASYSTANYTGGDINSVGYLTTGIFFGNGGGFGPTPASATGGNTICLALDLGNKKLWIRIGSGNWNNDILANQDPASNIGGADYTGVINAGPYFPVAWIRAGDQITARFAAASFTQSVPSGFAEW